MAANFTEKWVSISLFMSYSNRKYWEDVEKYLKRKILKELIRKYANRFIRIGLIQI